MQFGLRSEVLAGSLRKMCREAQRLQLRQRSRELVDGIVLPRKGAMSAGVVGLESLIAVPLFRGLERGEQRLPIAKLKVSPIGIQAVLGIDQRAVRLE